MLLHLIEALLGLVEKTLSPDPIKTKFSYILLIVWNPKIRIAAHLD